MGYLVTTYFVHKDKSSFTGDMMEQTTLQGALDLASETAERIGKELGIPVIREDERTFNIQVARVTVGENIS